MKNNFLDPLLKKVGAFFNKKERSKEGQKAFRKPKSLSMTDKEAKALADQFKVEYAKTPIELTLPKSFYKKVPYTLVKKYFLIPFSQDKESLFVASFDPININGVEELKFYVDKQIKLFWAPKDFIGEAIRSCYNREEGAASQMVADLAEQKKETNKHASNEVIDLLEDEKTSSPIIRLLNLIITEAIQQKASDIHFEPYEDHVRIRYRIDGVLQERHTPGQEYQSQMMTRLKVMAKLDIAEHRLPQDGRMKLKMGGREIDFRVSTIPVAGGERIVMRILDKENVLLGLDQIGMAKPLYQKFRNLISCPEGIVLVTGPTGSGKTTTLYSAICDRQSDEVNIMTIEDPIEYHLKGIAQIETRPKIGMTFSAGLRHILRQDPDIVMIGEIRDRETAEIAIQAALTGHLVLSTLHTNDAPSAMTRLIDMGVEPFLLSSSIIGVLAQRLVRKICNHCKEPYKPSKEECLSLGVKKGEVFYRGKGCDQCFRSGYKGRHGIYELMSVSDAIKKQLMKTADASDLRKVAISEGMISLRDNGLDLVKQGVTTIEEVFRVTRGI